MANRAHQETTDRLALSRAQHLQSRNHRPKSISDDEVDSISDWSESDRECCPLSDYECQSNRDGNCSDHHYDGPFDNDRLSRKATGREKPKQQQAKTSYRLNEKVPAQPPKRPSPPLLPARRIQVKPASPHRPVPIAHLISPSGGLSRDQRTVTPNPARFHMHRESLVASKTSAYDSTVSATMSSNDGTHGHRATASPNFSQTSMSNSFIPRVYDVKKLFVDDHDFGRLIDASNSKGLLPRNRQKWGTIVHPPFPLGYQQTTPEHVTQVVERLSSPVRCRDRHTPAQTPSKRYLSVEETDALVNQSACFRSLLTTSSLQISRLTKVKPIRSPEAYWAAQPRPAQSRKNFAHALKATHHLANAGITA